MTEMELEYATVGALLCAPGELPAVRDWLDPGDFTLPACRAAYTVACELRDAAHPVDPVTVMTRLRRHGPARRDGWPAIEVLRMVEAVPVPAAAVYYARLVVDAALLRALDATGRRLIQLGRGQGREPADALHAADATWAELDRTRRRWEQAYARPGSPRSLVGSSPAPAALAPAIGATPVSAAERGR